MKSITKVTIFSVLGLSILLVASSFLVRTSEAEVQDLLPYIRPVQKDLLDHDIVKDPRTGHILLRFAGSVANFGDGKLEVIGKRTLIDPDNNMMPAYQRIYRTDRTFYESRAGNLIYHPAHHHYHFESAVVYSLRDQNGVIATSAKQSFCLADVEKIDETLDSFSHIPIYNRCYHSPSAKFVKMGVSPGWSDVYGKDLVGQSLDVTELMKLPKQTYVLEATTNPTGLLIEKNDNPQTASVEVEIGQGVKVGVGISRPGV